MGIISKITGKKRKYYCAVTEPSESRHECGKKWGPKVEVKKADGHGAHIHKQCPKCEKKDEKSLKLSKHDYKCPECGTTHGQKYRKTKYADTSWKKCTNCKHTKNDDVSPGPFSF